MLISKNTNYLLCTARDLLEPSCNYRATREACISIGTAYLRKHPTPVLKIFCREQLPATMLSNLSLVNEMTEIESLSALYHAYKATRSYDSYLAIEIRNVFEARFQNFHDAHLAIFDVTADYSEEEWIQAIHITMQACISYLTQQQEQQEHIINTFIETCTVSAAPAA